MDRPLTAPASVEARFQSWETLEEAADAIAARAPELYRNAVFLYVISRDLVGVYESRNFEVPLQVWNEYRNALDHWMRFIAQTDSQAVSAEMSGADRSHVERMEGHIQRAVLDICKLLCIRDRDAIDAWVKSLGEGAFDLVDDGGLLPRIRQKQNRAADLLLEARVGDSKLGSDPAVNRDVIRDYVRAALEVREASRELGMKEPALLNAKRQIEALRAKDTIVLTTMQKGIRECLEAEMRPRAQRRSLLIGILGSLIVTALIEGIKAIFG